MYYYGARYYEPRLSLWMSVDPLQEKYPNISTYCYAANNPIKFIDSDGRKLLFASGTTEAFKQKFRAAIMYLHEHNADGIIAQIDKSSTIIYLYLYFIRDLIYAIIIILMCINFHTS